jgi:hypothetical protein
VEAAKPPAEVPDLDVVREGGKATLTWTDPDGDFDHIEITWTPPTAEHQPKEVAPGEGTVEIDGFDPDTEYTFEIRTVDKDGNKSEGKPVIPTDSTPPAEVTGLAATPAAGRVTLTWTNPTDGDFDHLEISYSTSSGLIHRLDPVAKTEHEKTITGLSGGNPYAFTVRTVDTSGNKSLGSLAVTSLANLVTDLDLGQYITAPAAGTEPDTRAIVGTQYTGTVTWKNKNGSMTPTFIETLYFYQAVVTLRANAGYTFAGMGNNKFTYGGADDVTSNESGNITITWPKLGRAWYVADYGNDAVNDGLSRTTALKTVEKALEKIAAAYVLEHTWPTADIIIIGTSGDTKTITINSENWREIYPPITLRGLGPTQPGILTADKASWTGVSLVVDITNSANVTLGNDLTITGGGKQGTVPEFGGGVRVYYKSTFTMNGGTITGNTASSHVGGIIVQLSSTFTMNGGVVSHNSAWATGGVAILSDSHFLMTGGTITENTADVGGGGLRFVKAGTCVISGGTISDNTSAADGGGVFITETVATMSGGTITGNHAAGNGGGIHLDFNTTFTIGDGTIANNTTSGYGGGVWLKIEDESLGYSHPLTDTITFTMQGGIIAGNTAASGGGGVAVSSYGANNVFKKESLTPDGASGIIYGNNAGADSNTATAGVTPNNKGHAVYIENGPKPWEVTVGPEQKLDSTVTGADGGWVE